MASDSIRIDWRETLANDVRLELGDVARDVIEQVLACIDDRGLLVDEPGEVAHILRLDAVDVDRVLAVARAVGPPGIGARSPVECVQLQCVALVARGVAPEILTEIAARHLELVAERDFHALASALACSIDEVEQAVAVMLEHVRPFVAFDGRPTSFVRPDLIIRRRHDDREELVVEVPDSRWYGLRTASMVAGAEEWLTPHIRAANDLVRQLDARANLLRRVGEDLIAYQRSFVVDGSSHAPLRRVDVAHRLEVHPSTVGRAVTDKWIQCPDCRVIPLSSCFGAASGPIETLTELLQRNPSASDRQLAVLLSERGIQIARRTVAKYRITVNEPARNPKPGSRQVR